MFVVMLFLVGSDSVPPPLPPLPHPPNGPLTVVSLGDSTLSGEGTGDYTAATNGADGDWCHRSPNAEIDQTDMPGVVQRINLACSGADSAQVGLGKATQWGETSQTAKLGTLAKHDRVVAVVVAVGANDDPHFADVVNSCVQAWLNHGSCSKDFEPTWQRHINAMVPKVADVLLEIKSVMARAGYSPTDYQLVLQSYAAPIGPDAAGNLLGLAGCPFRPVDLQWVHKTAVHALDDGMRAAAARAHTRFLDLADAGFGHEACSGGRNSSNEWFTRLSVTWQDVTNDQRVNHVLQSSFHPNALGAAAFGDCLSQFLATTDRAAACLAGPNGVLHPAALS